MPIHAGKVMTLSFTAIAAVLAANSAHAGACLSGTSAASAAALDNFNATPASILGGSSANDIADQVRSLAATNTDLAGKIVQVAATTSEASKVPAIGAGLGRAANVCKNVDPNFADAISKAVADAVAANPTNAALRSLQTAFQSALSGQTNVSSLGQPGAGVTAAGNIGGNGAGGAGGGGGTTTLTDTSQNLTNTGDGGALRTSAGSGGNFSTDNGNSLSTGG